MNEWSTRKIEGLRWSGVAILALLLAAGCTSATATPEAITPEATELSPPTSVMVAATQQAIPTATTAAPGAVEASPTAAPPAATATPPPVAVAMALPSIADIVEQVRPAVVSIVAEIVGQDFFGRPSSQFGSGTGVIVDPQGLVLTNNHVIEGATTITVTMDDGSQVEAEVVGADRLSDLAVLRIPPDNFTVH